MYLVLKNLLFLCLHLLSLCAYRLCCLPSLRKKLSGKNERRLLWCKEIFVFSEYCQVKKSWLVFHLISLLLCQCKNSKTQQKAYKNSMYHELWSSPWLKLQVYRLWNSPSSTWLTSATANWSSSGSPFVSSWDVENTVSQNCPPPPPFVFKSAVNSILYLWM